MKDSLAERIFGVLLILAYTIGVIRRKIESVFTFCRRKYYGYRFRTVEDAAKHVMEKK